MREVSSAVRRACALALLLSVMLANGAFAAGKERRGREVRRWIQNAIVVVLEKLGIPPG